MTHDPLRYPVGPFVRPTVHDAAARRGRAARLVALPAALADAVRPLDASQLDTPYRPGGWTVRQVVHHLGDSHANALIRLKLGLTEHRPLLRPYDEDTWVRTADAHHTTLEEQLAFVHALHRRMAAIAEALDESTGSRVVVHPESGEFTIDELVAMYAWHGEHHVAHITTLRARSGW